MTQQFCYIHKSWFNLSPCPTLEEFTNPKCPKCESEVDPND